MNQCPACGEEIIAEFIERYDKYTLNRCPACDVIFSNPMENPGAEWYERSERYAVGKILPVHSWHHKQFLNNREFYGRRLLDIGCGTGIFLNKAREKGYEVWGIDFDKEAVRIAKERYRLNNVYVMDVESLFENFSQDRFDIISFFEVLEHLDNSIQFIRQIKNILKPRGYVAISVPNRERTLETMGDGDYPPNHLTRWNRYCLSAFLEQNGFKIVRCVVKKMDAEEVAGYLKAKIRFGIGKGLVMRGIEADKPEDIQRAATLMSCKDLIFKGLTLPLIPILSVLSLEGTGLYVLARLK